MPQEPQALLKGVHGSGTSQPGSCHAPLRDEIPCLRTVYTPTCIVRSTNTGTLRVLTTLVMRLLEWRGSHHEVWMLLAAVTSKVLWQVV